MVTFIVNVDRDEMNQEYMKNKKALMVSITFIYFSFSKLSTSLRNIFDILDHDSSIIRNEFSLTGIADMSEHEGKQFLYSVCKKVDFEWHLKN